MNKVMLFGTLADKPELRFTQAGKAILNCRVVTTRKWQGKEFRATHKVTLFGDQAADVAPVLFKGSWVFIEGELTNRSYTDKQGATQWITEVNAQAITPTVTREATEPKATAPVFSAEQIKQAIEAPKDLFDESTLPF